LVLNVAVKKCVKVPPKQPKKTQILVHETSVIKFKDVMMALSYSVEMYIKRIYKKVKVAHNELGPTERMVPELIRFLAVSLQVT